MMKRLQPLSVTRESSGPTHHWRCYDSATRRIPEYPPISRILRANATAWPRSEWLSIGSTLTMVSLAPIANGLAYVRPWPLVERATRWLSPSSIGWHGPSQTHGRSPTN